MDIKQLKELSEGATPGEWKARQPNGGSWSIWTSIGSKLATVFAPHKAPIYGKSANKGNVELIVFLRNSVPDIIALAERVVELESETQTYRDRYVTRTVYDAVKADSKEKAERVEFLEKAPHWVAFDTERPADRQEVFLTWRWRSSDDWNYAHALFIDEPDGYYFVHAHEVAEHWVVEENLDNVEFFWQAESIPLKRQAEVGG